MFSTDVTRISIDPEVSEHVVLIPLDTWCEIVEFCRRHGEVLPSFDAPPQANINPSSSTWEVATFGDDLTSAGKVR